MDGKKLVGFLSWIGIFLWFMGQVPILVSAEGSHTPIAKTTIDIQAQNKKSQEMYVSLDGQWEMFGEQLIFPEDLQKKDSSHSSHIVKVPGSFEKHLGKVNSFATYTTTVQLPEDFVGQTIAIHIPFQYSAYRLFVDEVEIASNGTVGTTAATHHAEMAPRTGYFIVEHDRIQITLHLSSYDHIRGGFENSIFIGKASTVTEKNNSNMILLLFINGNIFITGLFMFLFSLYRRKEQVFLFFGLFSMLIAARALFTVPFYYTIIFPQMSWVTGTRLEYIFTEATSMLFVILLWKWHENEFSKKVMVFLVAVHASLMIVTLFTQPVFFQMLFFKVFYLAIPTFFYTVYAIVKSIRNKNRLAKINVIGMVLIFLAFFNDFAIGNNWYQSIPLMLPAVGIYVVIHVIAMSKGFAAGANEIEKQYEKLLVLNKSNEQLTIQLQDEIKRKDDFLANTSHELRNPLHGIINIAQAMIQNHDARLTKEMKEDLQLQLAIGHHMRQTLGDLLDVTRLKEQRIQLQMKSLYIQDVVPGIVDMLSVLLTHKAIQIHIGIPQDFPPVEADRDRFIQIMFNLLHNAVKYTENGTITIQAKQAQGWASVHVADTGVGMDEEMLSTIFEPYVQGDASMTSTGSGFGLGLSIVKKLVELHGGALEVSSTVGSGSTFTFTLPFATAQTKSKADDFIRFEEELEGPHVIAQFTSLQGEGEQFSERSDGDEKPRILAVDDDPVNLKILTKLLRPADYEVVTATSGEEALALLPSREWDLIISDVMMPQMSGYELTKAIRKQYSIAELPIILLTARGNAEDVLSGFLAGANDYVTKPVDAVELFARVHALTSLQTAVKNRLNMEAAWLQAQIRPHFMLNTLNAILSLSEIDIDQMIQLLEKFGHYLQRSFYLKNIDSLIPLEEELNLLDAYLYIEEVRFGERLQIHWHIDKSLDLGKVKIPPLVLQTIVENAVNHGVLQQADGGTIMIQITRDKGIVTLSVQDDGVGMDRQTIDQMFTIKKGARRGIGIVNTEQRLKRLFGKGLQVESAIGKGTTVSFQVPYGGEVN